MLQMVSHIPWTMEKLNDYDEHLPHVTNKAMLQKKLKLVRKESQLEVDVDCMYQLNIMFQFNEFLNEINTPSKQTQKISLPSIRKIYVISSYEGECIL